MIRRLGLALLLITLALVGLHFVIGFENFAHVGGGSDDGPIQRRDANRATGPGVVVGEIDGRGGALSVSGRGPVDFRRDAEYPLDDGSVLLVPRWTLHAEDSDTVQDDLLQLFTVEATFFRTGVDRAMQAASATPMGLVEAREALVVVGRNEEGLPSIQEDREMDLFDVRMRTVPEPVGPDRADSAPAGELRFDVARLLTRHTGNGLTFHTPTRFESFRAEASGRQPAVLTGRGLDGVLPAVDEDRPRADDDPAPTVARFDVASEVQLDVAHSTLRSAGPLSYREHQPSGRARLTLRDTVQVQTTATDLGHGEIRVRADEFDATSIRRTEQDSKADEPAELLELRLRGNPGTIGDDRHLLSFGELTVHAGGPQQLPWAISASGAPRVELRDTGQSIRTTGAMHLSSPRLLHDRLLRAGFGVRGVGWPRLLDARLRLRGETRVESPGDQLMLTASDGLVVVGAAADDAAPLWLRAEGRVEARQGDQLLVSEDGAELSRRAGQLELRIGKPTAPTSWTVTSRLQDGRQLVASGLGWARVVRREAESTTLRLAATTGTLTVRLGDELQLDELVELEVDVAADDSLRRLVARAGAGQRCEFSLRRGDEQLLGRAGTLLAEPGFVRLDGPGDAVLERRRESTLTDAGEPAADMLRGGRIDVYGTEPGRALIDVRAHADGRPARLLVADLATAVTPTATATANRDETEEASEIELRARRIRLLPGLVLGAAADWHGLGTPARRLATGERLEARGDVVVERRRRSDGLVLASARGDALDSGAADARAVLQGSPAIATIVDLEQGRRLVGRAPRLRFGVDPANSQASLVLEPGGRALPELDLLPFVGGPAEATARPDDSGGPDAMRLICDGAITAAGATLEFGGPVRLRELDPATGTVLADGLALAAGNLVLDWDPERRLLATARATAGADFRVRGVTASAERIDVDFLTERCTLLGDERGVTVDLRGRRLRGAAFLLDYRNLQIDGWNVRSAPRRETGGSEPR